MPLKEHPSFKSAPTPESKLWRYMGLSKYLSFLQNHALFFSNLESLAQSDPFEGTLPASRFKHRNWKTLDDVPENIKNGLKGRMRSDETDLEIGFQRYIDSAERSIKQAYAWRRANFISCWHLSEHESSAMWDIYSKKNEGISIVATEARVKEALSSNDKEVRGGLVEYDDYLDESFEMDDKNAFTPVLYKRNSFSYENEYRLVYSDNSILTKETEVRNGIFHMEGEYLYAPPNKKTVTISRTVDELNQLEVIPGINIDCDINELVEEIYVSPLAENWFFEVVKKVTKSYGLNAPVTKSPLLSEPLK